MGERQYRVGQSVMVKPSEFRSDHYSGAALVLAVAGRDVLVLIGQTEVWFTLQRLEPIGQSCVEHYQRPGHGGTLHAFVMTDGATWEVVRRLTFAGGNYYTEPRLTGLTERQAYDEARAYVGGF